MIRIKVESKRSCEFVFFSNSFILTCLEQWKRFTNHSVSEYSPSYARIPLKSIALSWFACSLFILMILHINQRCCRGIRWVSIPQNLTKFVQKWSGCLLENWQWFDAQYNILKIFPMFDSIQSRSIVHVEFVLVFTTWIFLYNDFRVLTINEGKYLRYYIEEHIFNMPVS